MEQKQELKPIYDTAKEFYKKAFYTKEKTTTSIIYKLYSYNSLVAILEVGKDLEVYYNNKIVRLYLDHDRQNQKDFYSKTTLRHIKEFIKQMTDNIRHNSDYSIVYYDKNKTLHLYSIEILRKATKMELFQYALDYDF